MKKIHLYTSLECPHCSELKQLLTNAGYSYEVTDVDKEEEVWDELCEKLDIEFVPTVIIVDEKLDTAKLLTPDVHFDEVIECYDQIVEELS
tara:strand:- start:82 stop:354 length:273 start_codon:yes stop_codon:yes gene_type:complete